MTKRKRFLETLENILYYSLNNDAVAFSILAMFVIICGILGFMFSKQVPVPLTEKEIEYYTSQAEIGYLKGAYYLDENIAFIPINNTTFKVFSLDQSEEKQKLKVTFSGNVVSSTAEVYYSVNFIANRIVWTLCGALNGFLLWLLLIFFMEYISSIIPKSTKCDSI